MVANNSKKKGVKKTSSRSGKKRVVSKGSRSSVSSKSSVASSGPEKKINPIKVLVGFVLFIAIVFGATLLLSHDNPSEKDYNNFVFTQGPDGLWYVDLEINGVLYNIVFHYHPSDLENISVDPRVVSLINSLSNYVKNTSEGSLYISLDPEADASLAMAGVEVAKILGEKYNIYNIPTSAVYSRPFNDSLGTPVINCANRPPKSVVLEIRTGDSNSVFLEDTYCIVVEGVDGNSTIKSADRLDYALLKIMS